MSYYKHINSHFTTIKAIASLGSYTNKSDGFNVFTLGIASSSTCIHERLNLGGAYILSQLAHNKFLVHKYMKGGS